MESLVAKPKKQKTWRLRRTKMNHRKILDVAMRQLNSGIVLLATPDTFNIF